MSDATTKTTAGTKRQLSSVAQTAAQVRAALKAAFPGIKFSVRAESFSMGSAVRIAWVDGPTTKQVEKVSNSHERIDRDQWGEILSGGNRYITASRIVSDRVKAFAKTESLRRFGTASNVYEQDRLAWQVEAMTEVRPDGQLIAWREVA